MSARRSSRADDNKYGIALLGIVLAARFQFRLKYQGSATSASSTAARHATVTVKAS